MTELLSDLSAGELLVLSACVFLAGIVDAIAGGGGLITLPAYLSTGLHPGFVVGTNKLSATIGGVASIASYLRALKIPLKPMRLLIAAAIAGSILGALLQLRLDPRFLKYLVLAAIPSIGIFILVRKEFGRADRSHTLEPGELHRRSLLIAFPMGGYDGFFGPGTGTLLTFAFAKVCRYDFLKAAAHTKVLNVVSSLSALALFLASGRVHLGLGISMGVISLGGNYVGARLGLKKGADAIRPVLVAVSGALFLKLLFDVAGGRL